ncbi:uncharacterized protein BDR25DRAFT_375279 [Lindgomyces ingoldianus]|uniref:Uncharacterized protein n=1 Tax=Lindgomyces ingoldianus TaxID=673940 RepID=A0ACB6RAZ3_9PLEO|nr:uncharacterized protein BDR25DRAFT_375279 [Lindgomyces ingoldianus]KAF2476356.1 hypothetical protein BDR25DRAFT_375279 [Lindgomyces ingoldianus]
MTPREEDGRDRTELFVDATREISPPRDRSLSGTVGSLICPYVHAAPNKPRPKYFRLLGTCQIQTQSAHQRVIILWASAPPAGQSIHATSRSPEPAPLILHRNVSSPARAFISRKACRQCLSNPQPHQLVTSTESPDGGVSLHSSDITGTPNIRTPPSSKRIANVGIRRSQYTSVLLESPARPSHASRMRQIFEEASFGKVVSSASNGMVAYPQLPNTSRAHSPTDRHPQSSYGPGFLLPSNRPDSAEATPERLQRPTSSENLSESWSGDSDYLITEHRYHRSSRSISPQPRIDDWLSTVSQEDGFSEEKCVVLRSQATNSVPSASSILPSHYNRTPPPSVLMSSAIPSNPVLAHPGRLHRQVLDVCLSKTEVDQPPKLEASQYHGILLPPETPPGTTRSQLKQSCTPHESIDLDDGGIQLSPLSPNVCIARGPSRYHSSLRRGNALGMPITPTRREGVLVELPRSEIFEEIRETHENPSRISSTPTRRPARRGRASQTVGYLETANSARRSGGVMLEGL